jgi:hypothetical protein
MHDTRHRGVRAVTNRIDAFLRPDVKLSRLREELTRYRIAAIAHIDELRNIRGQRKRVTLGNPADLVEAGGRNKSRGDQILGP